MGICLTKVSGLDDGTVDEPIRFPLSYGSYTVESSMCSMCSSAMIVKMWPMHWRIVIMDPPLHALLISTI